MLKRLSIIEVVFLLLISVFSVSKSQAQFIIIPVFVGNTNGLQCTTSSNEAMQFYRTGNEIKNTNAIAAANYYKQAVLTDKLFCDAYYAIIQQYMKLNNNDSALKYTELALELNKTKEWLLLLKGQLLLANGEAQKSAEHFRELMEMQPTVTDWMYYHIEALIQLQELDSAKKLTIDLEKNLTERYAEYPGLSYYLQGKIAFFKKDYETASKAFFLIRYELKKYEGASYYYGVALLNQATPDLTKAKKYVKKAYRQKFKHIDPEVLKQLNIS